MPRFVLLLTLALLSFTPSAGTAQWATFGDTQQLTGKVVTATGTVSARSETVQTTSPYGGYPTTETMEWGEFQGAGRICFEKPFTYIGYREAALILVDERGIEWLAILKTNIGSVEVSVSPLQRIRCPD